MSSWFFPFVETDSSSLPEIQKSAQPSLVMETNPAQACATTWVPQHQMGQSAGVIPFQEEGFRRGHLQLSDSANGI